jgi:hypothetical protein
MFKRILALFLVLFLVGCGKGEPSKLDLERETLTLEIGEEYKINYTTNVKKEVTISLQNDGVLSITNDVIKALKVGSTTVTIAVGDLSKTLTVVVSAEINLEVEDLVMVIGGTLELGATSSAPLSYTSSDVDVATISENGTITAIAEGVAVIQVCLTDDSSVVKNIELKVISEAERDFNVAKENTEALRNYTLKITIRETVEETVSESIVYYKFDGNKFEFTNPNKSVFYETVEGHVYEYENTLEGYVKSEVEALPSNFSPFYVGITYDILDFLNNAYFVKYGKERAFNSIKNQFMATEINNIRITVLDGYYATISFNLTISNKSYGFTFEFIDINETVVRIPTV